MTKRVHLSFNLNIILTIQGHLSHLTFSEKVSTK